MENLDLSNNLCVNYILKKAIINSDPWGLEVFLLDLFSEKI